MNRINEPDGSRGLLSGTTVWLAMSMAAVLLLSILMRDKGRPIEPREGFQAQSLVQSNAYAPSSTEMLTAAVAPAADHNATELQSQATEAKRPEKDESPLRRWKFGTHWGQETNPALTGFSSWTTRYMAAEPAVRDTMLAEGITLAQSRRAALLELIANDPREALASAVPFAIRKDLPGSITDQLERTVSGKGDLLVLAAVPRDEAPGAYPSVLRRVHIGGERFSAHVFGQRANQRATTSVSLHGIAVAEQLALSDSPIRVLEPGEPAAEQAKVEPICSVSGLTAGSFDRAVVKEGAVMAASGDTVHWLCRGGHLEALEHKVQAAEAGSTQNGVTAASYNTTGHKKILVMMVDFPDRPGGAVGQSAAVANLNDVTAFIRANAYNQIDFTSSDVTPVLRMPRTSSSYATNDAAYDLLVDARDAAASAGYRVNNYDFDVVAFASIGFPWGGLGYVGAKGSWVQGDFDRRITAHELGHNLGNWHANSWVSSTVIGTEGTHVEYGNPFDVLGYAYNNYPGNHYNANFKFLFGWLPNTYIHTVTASGTYRIYAQDFGGNLNSTRSYAIRVPVSISVGGETVDYWIEFRPAYGSSATANGAILKWGNDLGTQFASRLLDAQPDTLGNMEDAPLLVGRTFTDSVRALSITTLARGGAGADAYLDVRISFGAPPPVTLTDALDLPSATWLTGGDQNWAGQSSDSHDGVDVAASGVISHNQQSSVETTVTGPGILKFWWKVSSEQGFDYLNFVSNGLVIRAISGEQTWQEVTSFVPAGLHTFRWRYSKDGSVVAGADRGWLDEVSFTPGNANDMFANASALSGVAAAALDNNNYATKETGEPNHCGNPGGKSVWWRWTAPISGRVGLNTAGSSFDTLLGVYTGSAVNSLTLVAGNDDSGEDLTSSVSFTAVAGMTYQIAVDGYNGQSGSFRLNLRPLPTLRVGPLQRFPNGTCRIWIANADGTPIDPARAGRIYVQATENLSLPMASWPRLAGAMTPANGWLWIEDPGTSPMRFYCASERP
jgi:hypothetical protein